LYSFQIEWNTEVTIRFEILNIHTALVFMSAVVVSKCSA